MPPLVVRNLRGTAGRRRCACGSWLDHWYNETRSSRVICGVYGCGEMATVGAHVEIMRGQDRGHYIVPTCHACNMNPEIMDLKADVIAVSANTQFMGCYLR
jgi:hypothetical protein